MTALGARNGALDQQQIAYVIDSYDFQILRGTAIVTIVSRHPLPWKYSTRILRHSDGTRTVMAERITVAGTIGTEVMSLDRAGEPFTQRGSCDINLLPHLELIEGKYGTQRNVCNLNFAYRKFTGQGPCQ